MNSLFGHLLVGVLKAIPAIKRHDHALGGLDGYKKLQHKLTEYGWYTSPSLTIGNVITLNENMDNTQFVDNFMQAILQKQLKSIELSLVKSYPKRKDILLQGFLCHHQELYSASIPIFLAQADGIWQDVNGFSAYKHAKINKQIKDKSVHWMAPYALAKPTRINVNTEHIIYSNQELNRNGVLHGNVTDYGTRLNSLKAISFLDYVQGSSKWDKK